MPIVKKDTPCPGCLAPSEKHRADFRAVNGAIGNLITQLPNTLALHFDKRISRSIQGNHARRGRIRYSLFAFASSPHTHRHVSGTKSGSTVDLKSFASIRNCFAKSAYCIAGKNSALNFSHRTSSGTAVILWIYPTKLINVHQEHRRRKVCLIDGADVLNCLWIVVQFDVRISAVLV